MDTKDAHRKAVWRLMEEKRVARFPGTRGRIPNFIGAERAACLLSQSPLWKKARTIKINPDSPQRPVRQRALEEGKILYMAVPRLRTQKPFIELDPKRLKASPFRASSIKGASQHGRPVSLAQVKKIDLIICGSVAVNREGARVGKGGGYSDLEYALLREEGKINAKTPVVTTVHPLQIRKDPMPMTEHDIPLSAMITPEEVLDVKKSNYRTPKGIYWQRLQTEKISSIPVLKARKALRDGQG